MTLVDVPYYLDGLRFIWDETKDRSNSKKHRLSFKVAAQVFLDPLANFEDASSDEEFRQSITGETEANQVVLVVHIEYEEGYIRIISAREATPQEKRRYEDNA